MRTWWDAGGETVRTPKGSELTHAGGHAIKIVIWTMGETWPLAKNQVQFDSYKSLAHLQSRLLKICAATEFCF